MIPFGNATGPQTNLAIQFLKLKEIGVEQDSSDRPTSAMADNEKLFAHPDITSRVPPDLYLYSSLLPDTQDLRLNEAAVVELLVRINADLIDQVTQNIQIQGGCKPGISDGSKAALCRSRLASPPVRNDDVAMRLPVLESSRAAGSPKARNILGL